MVKSKQYTSTEEKSAEEKAAESTITAVWQENLHSFCPEIFKILLSSQ